MNVQHDDLVLMIRTATADVFGTMLGLDVAPGDPYQHTDMPEASDGVISFIGLAGTWVGTGSIACSAQVACKISSLLLMTEYSAVDEEVLDAFAEVTNMIIGNVKTQLEERLGPLGLSIPTVIFGRNFTSRTVGTYQWTIVPFVAGEDRFQVQICLTPQKDGPRIRSIVGGSALVSM
jgi:chemotaxis protein CheX